jgi:hypothetical protein
MAPGPARRIATLLLAFTGLLLLPAGTAAEPYPDDEWAAPSSGTVVRDQAEVLETLDGYWRGDWGEIVLRVQGDDVIGVYAFQEGVVVGHVENGLLNAWWCELPSHAAPFDAGLVQMRVVVDDSGTPALDGRWMYAQNWDGTEPVWTENWDVADRQDASAAPELRARLDGATALCQSPFAGAATRLDVDDPSTLSSLPTLADLEITPVRAAATAGAAVAFIAIAFFPGILLDSTISANYERIFGWAAPIRRRLSAAGSALRTRVPTWLGVLLGIVAVVLISGFIEPRFGFNAGSLRVLFTIAVAVVLERLLFFTLAARAIRTRRADLAPTVIFRPGSILLVVVAVLLSRVTGFHPGIIFGIVLGLSFAVPLSAGREARLSLASSAYALLLGIVGWLGYSVLVALLGGSPGFAGVLAIETFSSLAIAGLTALPIALLPLKDLDGGVLWAWNRWIWAVSYAVALFAFLLIVLPLPASWDEVPGTFLVWVLLFVGYCVLAVGVWAFFRFRKRAPKSVQTPATPADVGGAS